jgi:hypothetical protein
MAHPSVLPNSSTHDLINRWNQEIVQILNNIRINSSYLSEKHRQRFFMYKQIGNYFEIPVIILSVFASSFAVGSQAFLTQHAISLISCFINILVTIITSIKIYLNIDNVLKNELEMSKRFYILSIDIYKILSLQPGDRSDKPLDYLNKVYTTYQKLIENSQLLRKRFKNDTLIELPSELYHSDSSNDASRRATGYNTPERHSFIKNHLPWSIVTMNTPAYRFKRSSTNTVHHHGQNTRYTHPLPSASIDDNLNLKNPMQGSNDDNDKYIHNNDPHIVPNYTRHLPLSPCNKKTLQTDVEMNNEEGKKNEIDQAKIRTLMKPKPPPRRKSEDHVVRNETMFEQIVREGTRIHDRHKRNSRRFARYETSSCSSSNNSVERDDVNNKDNNDNNDNDNNNNNDNDDDNVDVKHNMSCRQPITIGGHVISSEDDLEQGIDGLLNELKM